jgi:hypothetical protein
MQAARHDEQYRINSIAARPCKKRKDGARVPLSGKQNSPWRKLRHPSEEKPREQTKGPVGGARPIAERRAGPLTFFITNALCEPSQTSSRPSATMEIDLCGRAELCPSTKTTLEAASAPPVGAL